MNTILTLVRFIFEMLLVQMHQNNLELAAAIRELEASTAALQSTYGDTSSHTSHSSLQCSSGYATMNSTPCSSEDTIASGGMFLGVIIYGLYCDLFMILGIVNNDL